MRVLKSKFVILAMSSLLISLPVLSGIAQAQSVGFYGGGGFSGGSFRAGGAVAAGPGGGVAAVAPNVNVIGKGWGVYYGPGSRGAAAAAATLQVGAVVQSLPASAQKIVDGGNIYYYDGANYYQHCYEGSDVEFCVISNPFS